MRDFDLEVYFAKWEFAAKHHMTASDLESMSLAELLSMASAEDREAFENLWLGYTETMGAPDVRQAIADTYDTLSSENMLCLAGAGEGIYASMRILLSPGDHAIVPVPNYQSAETVPLQSCDVTGIALRPETGWRLDLDEVAAAIRPNTKLISINFPHNPTGMILPRADLDALVALCRQHGLYLFCDEVFRGVELNDDDRLPQVADVYERGISLGVLSKAYGLPGLRIGWLARRGVL